MVLSILGRKSVDDERQVHRWKGIVSRFKGKLVEMIKYANRRFDDYSISPKICYDYFFCFVNIKTSYYWFNKKELLEKAKEKYDNGGKEKAAEHYQANKDAIKYKANESYKNLSEKEKQSKKE